MVVPVGLAAAMMVAERRKIMGFGSSTGTD